jgi:predicted aldo/keto reductase-like oxidoreductase
MKLRQLGASGPQVSAVGLGCNNFGMKIDQAETQAVVGAALDAGITLFDTADSRPALSLPTKLRVLIGARKARKNGCSTVAGLAEIQAKVHALTG